MGGGPGGSGRTIGRDARIEIMSEGRDGDREKGKEEEEIEDEEQRVG